MYTCTTSKPPPAGWGRREEIADKAFYWRTVVGDLFGIILVRIPKDPTQKPLGVNISSKSIVWCAFRVPTSCYTIPNQNIESTYVYYNSSHKIRK